MQNITKQQELLNNYADLDLEKLPSEIKNKNYIWRLVQRENGKCLYAQHDGGRIAAFEVFKTLIRKHRERMIELKNRQGYTFNPADYCEYKEAWPCDEDFGRRAWTYPTLELALVKYDKIE